MAETRALRGAEQVAGAAVGRDVDGTVIADVAYSPVSTASSMSVQQRAPNQAPAQSVALMDVRYPPPNR